MRAFCRVFLPASLLLALATLSSVNAAGKPIRATPGVLPPNSSAYGHTYGEWSAMWWQWVFSSPAVTDPCGNNSHPQFDTTGAYTLAGQDDHKVIFLPAGFGADPPPQNLTRTITIPTGRPLFFPVVNAWADVLGEDPVPTIPELYSRVKGWVDSNNLTDLYATLNGKALVSTGKLPAYRVQSPPFAYYIPDDNFFALWGLTFPAQRVYPAVSDGYWLMLAPLPPGHYVLAFGNRTWLNVTYDITVVPGDRCNERPVAMPNEKVFGKTLTDWIAGYWRWYYSTGQNLGIYPTPGPFRPGPAPVVFMPMPGAGESTQTGGNWTPDDPAIMVGKIHATLRTGTGFVTPAFAWIAERYQGYPAVPDDPLVHNRAIRRAVFNPAGVPGDPPIMTLDGKPLLHNFWDYYLGPKAFTPPVVYPAPSSYGSVAAVAWQSVGMVVKPLSPGRHVMHLYEKYILTPADIDIPGYQMGVVYDNTWIIDVSPCE